MVNYRHSLLEAAIMPDINYMALTDWARQLGRTPEAANKLIQRGKLPEAVKIGRNWLIPIGTPWPEDRRYK